jgi:hypothetical protein
MADWMDKTPFHTMRAMQALNGAIKDGAWFAERETKENLNAWAHSAMAANPLLAMNPFVAAFAGRRKETLDQLASRRLYRLRAWWLLKSGELDDRARKSFGLRFDDCRWFKLAETDRIELWMVDRFEKLRKKAVPLVMVPPMVLDPGVLAWDDRQSFVHYLSERGIPTGIIVNKDIRTHTAVQTMSPEDFILDCRTVGIELGKYFDDTQIVFGGYCQGAENSLRTLATGKLKGIASSALVGVAPIDPTDVGTLYDNHQHLMDGTTLDQACATMPSGNEVIDGEKMRKVINYGNPEANNPVSETVRELALCNEGLPRTSGLVMWYWLNKTVPLPPKIIALTNKGYENPMVDGVYGYELFGERPDLKRLAEYGIENLWVGTAEKDTLVRQEASAMLVTLLRGIVDVNLCQYDKGHLGIVRDCCRDNSDEPLDGTSKLGQEGPVLWYRRVVKRRKLDPAAF